MRGISMLALSRLAKLATNAFFDVCGQNNPNQKCAAIERNV